MKRINKAMANLIRDYVVDSLNFEDMEHDSDAEELKARFEAEHFDGYYIRRFNGDRVKAMADWLAGLPSGVDIDFCNDDILNRLREFGIIDEKTKEDTKDRYIEEWFELLARFYVELAYK